MRFAEFFFAPRPSIRAVVKLACGAATAVVIAPALRAQDAAVAASTGATLDLIDDVAVRLALRTLISDAAANGLPTGPLVTKVREGVAKHAEPERIGAGIMQRGRRFLLIGDGALTLTADSHAATQAVVRGLLALTSWTVSEIETSATSIGITVPGKRGNRSVLFRQQLQLGRVRLFGGAGFGNTSRHRLDSHSATQ